MDSCKHPDFSLDHIHILGNGLKLTCNGAFCGGISLKISRSFAFEKTVRPLSCKLVPVLYWEYEYGLLNALDTPQSSNASRLGD